MQDRFSDQLPSRFRDFRHLLGRWHSFEWKF
jgi:hypothetical protein